MPRSHENPSHGVPGPKTARGTSGNRTGVYGHSRATGGHCLVCNARRGYGRWKLCSACAPAPWYAHVLPWLRRWL